MRYLTPVTLLLGALAVITPLQSQSAPDATSWPNIIPPTGQTTLLNWLNKSGYKENFLPEPKIHASPVHGTVKTYYNPILAGDLHAKRKVFRKGAAMVKELYSGNKVTGYSVMVKVQKHANTQGPDWLFYETADKTGQNALLGRNLSACAGCHSEGVDYLRSTFRPYK
ncbi:hypothetical protein [Crenothrix sp.]|uniref:hypothetical protein n=1 Tax=Crenothrix sp. TaxID=3100433 RepID=UPI00374CF984